MATDWGLNPTHLSCWRSLVRVCVPTPPALRSYAALAEIPEADHGGLRGDVHEDLRGGPRDADGRHRVRLRQREHLTAGGEGEAEGACRDRSRTTKGFRFIV